MTKKIFIFSFSLGVLILLISTVIFFGIQYVQTMDETYAALQGEASYAASGLEAGGIEYLRSLDNTNRITWISPDGSVLYDSEHPGLDMNQGGFPEVQKALLEGSGQGVRRSLSGGTQTMYYAFLCGDGTVLRLSRPLAAVKNAFQAVIPMLGGLLLVLVISAVLSFHIARSIANPINRLDLDNLGQAAVYPELYPLVERLREQRETIERQADERGRMRREFSANVSHELKTPLTSISGFAELMRDGLCDEERMIEFAGDIYRESQRLIALVNDTIRLSELDEGAVRQDMGEVDLVRASREVVKTLRPAAQRRGITIELEILRESVSEDQESTPKGGVEGAAEDSVQCGDTAEHEGIRVFGSSHIMSEMLYNLCDNAVKYNRDGGRVTVRLWQEGEAAAVSVEDTGIGIPVSEQERVFERFYRVDKSHSRQIGGTGLGLSIVKHAAQFHGAEIEMESEPGRGTRITVRIPKCPAEEEI